MLSGLLSSLFRDELLLPDSSKDFAPKDCVRIQEALQRTNPAYQISTWSTGLSSTGKDNRERSEEARRNGQLRKLHRNNARVAYEVTGKRDAPGSRTRT